MNIQADIKQLLEESGWPASRLASEAGIPAPVITRFLRGDRKGMHTRTLEKLWPFLYGDRRPTPVPPADSTPETTAAA